MKLVYLWVEDYKNIHKQGFNFSGQHRCHYDGKNLTIDENKDYIHIFPENINVTAIVGKNGSGKSSVAKIILMLIFYCKFKDFNTPNNQAIDGVYYNKSFAKDRIVKYKDSFFLIVKNNGAYKKLTIADGFTGLDFKALEDIDFFSIHFNYMIDTLHDNGYDTWIDTVYHRSDGYETPILLEPYKNDGGRHKINLEILEYLNNKRMLQFYSHIEKDSKITSFFAPNRIKLLISKLYGKKIMKYPQSTPRYEMEDGELYKLVDKFLKIQFSYTALTPEVSYNISLAIEKLYDNQDFFKLNRLYIVFKTLSSDKKYFDKDIYDKFVELISVNKSSKYIDNIIKFDISLLLKEKVTYETIKIQTCIDFEKFILEDTVKTTKFKSLFLHNQVSIEDNRDIIEYIPPWIDVEFFQDDKSIKSLSSGEKGLFTFLMGIRYQISNLRDESRYKSINLFFDETELGFHPEWQKKYLNSVLDVINSATNRNVNLIFLTHSPFLLSDIPTSNIVFLDNENGNCKVVDGLKDKKQTFGANIHTLFSDAFFMEDGLMGEFAKEKINEAIKYLNQKTLAEEEIVYCENIISIIGEPILKRQLQNMLDSKRLSKIESVHQKIKNMEYELEVLKKHQALIVKDEIKDRAKRKYYKKKDD